MPKFNKVLLVDDDPITVLVCERILQFTGFAEKIIPLKNGQEALDYVERYLLNAPEQLPEIIFLDLNMPVMDGWEFLEKYQYLKPSSGVMPAVYILSSTVDPEDKSRGLAYAYVRKFISKPLTKEHLNEIEPVQK